VSPAEPEEISAETLASCVERLGEAISIDHPDGLVLVGVLKGSYCFYADLARAITVPCYFDFLALSAYAPGETRVRILKDLDQDVSGQAVVVVQDIVDTGLSTQYIVGLLAQRRARSIRVCTLLERPERRIVPVTLDYIGMACSDTFLVGYGLDFAQRYRNLPSLHRVDPEVLVRDRERFEEEKYAEVAYRSDETRE
jgi:hypoxanthine phosphoribosyltransferase